jgi:hypothetical protein
MAKTVGDDIMTDAASETNSQPFSLTLPEAANQAFLKGWPVQVYNGLVQGITSDTPGNVYGVVAQDFHNLAAAGVYGVAGQVVASYIANGTNIFAANLKGAGLTDHVLVEADLARTYGIQRDTTNNKVFLDSSVVSAASARVYTLRPAQNTDIGDTNGRVLFLWLMNFGASTGTS